MTGTARALSAQAHGLRNQLNVLAMAAGMLDDPELATELRGAAGALARSVERLVASARVELGEQPADTDVSVRDLVALAERRLHREGRPHVRVAVTGSCADTVLRVPGTWAERLVADLLHLMEGSSITVTADDAAGEQGAAGVLLGVDAAAEQPDELLQRLATALRVELDVDDDGHATVRGLQRA